MKSFLLALFTIAAIACTAQPADSSFTTSSKINKAYFLNYLSDSKFILSAPLHASAKTWIAAGTLVAADVSLIYFDKQINAFAQNNRTHVGDQLSSHFFEHLSNGLYSVPLNFGIVGLSYLTKDKKLRSASLQTLKAMALAGIAVTVPKYGFQRHRPFQDTPPDNLFFEGPFGDFTHNSFPSGHTCSAFAIAAVYSSYYRSTIYVPIVAYSLASLTALSRVNDNKHWASDVLIGAALGFAIGKIVARNVLHPKAKKQVAPE